MIVTGRENNTFTRGERVHGSWFTFAPLILTIPVRARSLSLMTSNICSDARTSDEARPTKLAKLEEAGTMSVNSTVRLLVQRHPSHPLAKLPTRGSALAAGYDLYSAEKVVLPQGGRKVVQTGICVAIPDGHYGRVAPRSGLASKHGIDTGAGVIDQDYRGLLGVLLFNLGEQDFISKCDTCLRATCNRSELTSTRSANETVDQGDRIAQLILEKISTPDVQEVESLSETLRGAGGFGSTGGFGTQTTPSTADATAAAVAADLPAEVNAKSS